MTTAISVEGFGISVTPPSGWDAVIKLREADESLGEKGMPILQLSTIDISGDIGTYGAVLVEDLGPGDVLISLVEYEAEDDAPLFYHLQVVPTLYKGDFSTRTLQRTIAGQGGSQTFFSVSGRHFSLYVVLGAIEGVDILLPLINQILETIEVAPGEAAATPDEGLET